MRFIDLCKRLDRAFKHNFIIERGEIILWESK